MDLAQVTAEVAHIPHTTPDKGAILYRTVLEGGFERCLELGVAHGVGTAYVAAALEEAGRGTVTAVDRPITLERRPRADHLLERLGLTHRAELVFHEISYTWFLMDCLRQGRTFEFCFLDGAHTWDVDGFAFFLVDRLLEPGGLIIFDDLDWCFETSPTLRDKPEIRAKPEIERTTRQVRAVFDLLVRGHPSYPDAHEEDGWGYARKR
jgi:predicted O-methyltransferase YrrM